MSDGDLVKRFRGDCAGGDFLNPFEGIRGIEAAPARVAHSWLAGCELSIDFVTE